MRTRSHFYSTVFIALLSVGLLASCDNTKKEEKKEVKKEVKVEVEEVVEPKYDLVKAKAEIQAANDAFCKLISEKDSVGLTLMYTKDAKFMASGGPSAVDHEQIQTAMHSIFASGITEAKITTKAVFGNEDLLVEESNVTLFVDEQKVADEKALVVWKKVDGEWKLFRDIFNSNLPAQ